jgi:thiol:disulfide interchange protein/DsbC/DsbD-like thiol-disulfide interchange protein
MRFLMMILIGWVAAFPAAANPVQREHTRVELVAESASVTPGQKLTLALHMVPQPGWHTYFKNFGDVGVENSVRWTLPQGASVSDLSYPTPVRIETSGVVNFGYKGPATLLATVTLPQTLPDSRVALKADFNWLICSDELCVPESAMLSLTLPRGDGAIDPARRSLFMQAREALPVTVEWPAQFAADGKGFRLSVKAGDGLPSISSMTFFPYQAGIIAAAAPQRFSQKDAVLMLEGGLAEGADVPAVVPGILRIETTKDAPPEGFSLAAQKVASLPGMADAATDSVPGPLAAFLLAIAGGLLLNLMPCVFPILSLKALTLVKGAHGADHAKRDALFYTFGVMATFVLLAAVLLGLRAAGETIGWGFQLQDPRIVGLLGLLMVAVALNLFGLFEINSRFVGAGQSLTQGSGRSSAFWTGALAVLVATPCTAPFMAPALGAALALPSALGLGIFAGLGLGMALPFLAIGYIPSLRRWLPRPGAWMATFKAALGFPMLATALWLFWVAGQQAGIDAMVWLLAAALLAGLAFWIFGMAQRRSGLIGPAVALACLLAALAVPLTLKTSSAEAASGGKLLAAKAFSETALSSARTSGKPVFVYFTADWCISCKVNERTTLASSSVGNAFKEAQVQVLVGDWTKRDDGITKVLASHGRSGVPLYLWYAPGKDEPVILPQILTPDIITSQIAG